MYSVIVPVYNAEKYLNRCIDSILNQTLSNLELILVDDGSKDKSGDICRQYAEKDSRVVYIKTENRGVSSARNTGIVHASGEYIGFVDSDDEILPNMYEALIKSAKENDAEIVICDATTVYANATTEADTLPVLKHSCKISRKDITVRQLSYMAGAAWRCIYKRELIQKENIRFPLGIKLSEDRIFNILAMGLANDIYYLKESFYLRYVIDGSAVNKYHSDYLDIVINAHKKTEEALVCGNFSDDFFDAYKMHVACGALSAIYNEFHPSCKNKLSKKIKNIKEICFNEYIQNNFPNTVNDKKLRLVKEKKIYQVAMLAIVRKILKRKNY